MTMHGTSTPIGFRFLPTEKEILVDYLLNKVSQQPLPSDAIKEIDLYGDEKIWQRLFEESVESFFYFFTKLKKKTERGSRIERVSGFGCWRAQKDTKVHYRKHHIGSKRTFSYIAKGKRGSSNAEGRWTMTEYRLDGCLLKHVKNNDYVVGQIKKLKRRGEEDDGIHVIHSTSVECVTSLSGANSTYTDCTPANYSSTQQQIQMAPTEPNNATSILEAQAGQMMMEYSGSNNVIRDNMGYFAYPQAYGYDSSFSQQVQMTSIECNGISASKEVSTFENQGQKNESTGSICVTGDSGDDLGYLVFDPQAYGYDSTSQQEVQMFPVEPSGAFPVEPSGASTSTEVRFETQEPMNETGCTSVTGDGSGFIQSYGNDPSSAQEVQMSSVKPTGDSTSVMNIESSSINITGDNQYEFMKNIQWEDDSLWV